MGMPSDPDTQGHKQQKPPRRQWRASEPFFDMRLSHWTQALLAFALLVVAGVQASIYFSQAGIMNDQLAEMRSSSAQTDQTISVLQKQARIMADQLSVSRDE